MSASRIDAAIYDAPAASAAMLRQESRHTMNAGQALLQRAIDYAGLFPPAALDLQTTVSNYQNYLDGPHAWGLGRLVLPAALANDFMARWPSLVAKENLSIAVGRDAPETLSPLHNHGFLLDCIECSWTGASQADKVQHLAAANAKVFFEIPLTPDPETLIQELAARGACAKMRTGGVVANAIPSVSEVTRFIACCIRNKVPFKATAGLHHPFRGDYPLTGEEGSQRAIQHGYVNLILAGASLCEGRNVAFASQIVSDVSPANFTFTSEGIAWRNHMFTVPVITDVRAASMLSFGSCSFLEPMTELTHFATTL